MEQGRDARSRVVAWVRRPESLLLLALTAAGVVVATRSAPSAMVDDVGITARDAERIGSGKGWTYNVEVRRLPVP